MINQNSRKDAKPKTEALNTVINRGFAAFWFLLVIFGLCRGRAQDQPQTPGAPFAFPTGNVSWTVTIKYHAKADQLELMPGQPGGAPGSSAGADKGGEVLLQKIEVTEVDGVSRSILTYTNGKTAETWQLKSPSWVLCDRPDVPGGVVVMTNPMLMADLRPDASLFAWVKDESFVKNMTYRGKPCDYYEKTFPMEGGPPGRKMPVVRHQAWLDSQTGYPIGMDNTQALYVFTFNPPPSGPLTLPDRFQQQLTQMENSVQKPVYLGKPRSWGNP